MTCQGDMSKIGKSMLRSPVFWRSKATLNHQTTQSPLQGACAEPIDELLLAVKAFGKGLRKELLYKMLARVLV